MTCLVCSESADDLRGDASDKCARRDVLRDDGAGCYDGVVADRDALKDHGAGGDPHAAADADRGSRDRAAAVAGSSGWPELISCTFGPMITSSPMSMPPKSIAVQPWFTNTLRPNRRLRPPSV